MQRLIGTIEARHGRLDYAFNNGGSIGNEDVVLLGDMGEESWRRTIDGYLTSVSSACATSFPAS